MTGKFCNVLDPYNESINPRTINYSTTSECVFDSNIKSEQEEQYPPIDEWKSKWIPANGIVTYAVTNQSDDSTINGWENMSLAIALRTWGLRITKIKFRRERVDPINADIVMKFDSPDTNDYFKNRPNVLAYAYFPGQGKISGDVTFNDQYIWGRDGLPISAHLADPVNYPDPDTSVQFRTYNIIHTLTHEVGHSLGLRHNELCNDCMMFPYYNGYVTLHSNDIKRIQGFYGKRILSEWIYEYFRKRLIRKFNGKRMVDGVV